MAGHLAVTARKSIPVENRSGRLFSAAGVGALVIATSQWAHWMGYADWDLLSLIPGFAQVTGLLPNAYASGREFDCPNKTLGSEIALMSDDMLKTVGKTLCTKEELIAASLRGGDGQPRYRLLVQHAAPAEVIILPLAPVTRAPLAAPKVVQVAPAVAPAVARVAKPFTLARLAPVQNEVAKDLLEEINRRARQVDSIDPCSGALATRSSAGCGIEQVPVGDHNSGGGSSGGPGGGRDDSSDIEYEDHTGSGGGSSGSGGEGGEGGEHSNGGEGGDHSGGGDYAGGGHEGGDGHDNGGDGGEGGEGGHSDGGSHDGDGSHGGSDYTDNGSSHDGDTSHGGESGHDGIETADGSHDYSGDGHSGSGDGHSGGSDGGEHGGGEYDGGSSHGGGQYDGGDHKSGGEGGESGKRDGGHG